MNHDFPKLTSLHFAQKLPVCISGNWKTDLVSPVSLTGLGHQWLTHYNLDLLCNSESCNNKALLESLDNIKCVLLSWHNKRYVEPYLDISIGSWLKHKLYACSLLIFLFNFTFTLLPLLLYKWVNRNFILSFFYYFQI